MLVFLLPRRLVALGKRVARGTRRQTIVWRAILARKTKSLNTSVAVGTFDAPAAGIMRSPAGANPPIVRQVVLYLEGEFLAMRAKRVIAGMLFVVVAAICVPLSRAMDAEQTLPTPPEPGVLAANGDVAWYTDTDKGKGKDADACSACPDWYGYAEALFLQRTNCSTDQPIIVNLRGPNNTVLPIADAPTVLSTSDLNFDFEPGVRVVLGHRLCNGWGIEGGYLGLFDADTSAFVEAGGEDPIYTFPGGLGSANVFGDVDRVWVDYSSSLQSAELNFVCCNGCCNPCEEGKGKSKGEGCGWNMYCRTFEWLVGFRYVNWREHLRIHGERFETSDFESGVYDIRTSSNLYGPQVGARFRHWGKKWGWEATGKAGIFGCDAQQEQYVIDWQDYTFPDRTHSVSDGQVAFLGELNLTAIYRLNDVWNLRAGYNVIWLTGVALAPDQLDFSGEVPAGNQIASDGGVFLHGVNVGLEARW